MAQEIFERYEKKYLLGTREYAELLRELAPHMTADVYGNYTVSNIYFDTEDFRLVRASLEKPVYKEKLRLRCYGSPAEDGTAFVEIKKKYGGIVYKRRIPLRLKEAERYLYYGLKPDLSGADFVERQIFREIDYLKERLMLRPAARIAYDRTAFSGTEDPELRVTFDRNIVCRDYDLKLGSESGGRQLLADGQVLMEVKVPQGMPLWMCRMLNGVAGCETSFSKYGAWYRVLREEQNKTEGGRICA